MTNEQKAVNVLNLVNTSSMRADVFQELKTHPFKEQILAFALSDKAMLEELGLQGLVIDSEEDKKWKFRKN